MYGLPSSVQRLYCETARFQPVAPYSGISATLHVNLANALQEWTGTFFRDETLRNLGQTIQLGHYPGDTCTSPQRCPRPFSVVHNNGVHQIDVLFCGCNLATVHGDRVQQLMRWRLFPATKIDPQTGSTFSLLESARVLSVQSKLSLYDFYKSVESLTSATGVSGTKVSSSVPARDC